MSIKKNIDVKKTVETAINILEVDEFCCPLLKNTRTLWMERCQGITKTSTQPTRNSFATKLQSCQIWNFWFADSHYALCYDSLMIDSSAYSKDGSSVLWKFSHRRLILNTIRKLRRAVKKLGTTRNRSPIVQVTTKFTFPFACCFVS